MKTNTLSAFLVVAVVAVMVTRTALAGTSTPPDKTLVSTDRAGLAIQGWDPVAYFTVGKPVPGDARYVATHDGATYRFSSQAHRDHFVANPSKYVPAYGGFCGYAASIGKVRPANPELWSIVEGRLILQNTRGAVKLWETDVPGNKAKADRYWPRLVEAKSGSKDPIDGLFGKSVLGDLK